MTTTSSTAARNREVASAFLAGTHSANIDDLEIIDKTVSPRIRCHGFPGGNPVDRQSYKRFFRAFRRSFTDMEFDVLAMVSDEEFVAAHWRMSVNHVGDFAGVRADGRRITFDGMVLYRMEEGLIAETWLHVDELSMLRQIGAMPAIAA